MAKNEAKVKFTADTKEFNEEIQKANKEIGTLRSELKLNATQMNTTGTSVSKLNEKQKLLQKQQEATKNKTQALEKKLESAKKIYGEDSQEVARLTKQLNASKEAELRVSKEIEQTNKSLKEQKRHLGLTEKQAESFKNGFNKVGNVAGAVGAGVGAVAGGSIALFKEVDEGSKNAIKATGATGEAAEKLRTNYKNVASDIRGEFSDIGSTLGEVQTRFDITGNKSEKITKKFIKFAEINNTDGATSVQLVTRALKDADLPLKNYESLLDQLTVAAQVSGINIDTLTAYITKYGAPMRNLGFDTKESISIFAGWEKAGVNTQIAFSGMKKAISNWSASGKDAKVEFGKTLDKIKQAPSLAKATTIAIENFGQKAGPDLADAIRNGRFEYSDYLKLLKSSKGAVENTYKEVENGTDEAQIAVQNLKLAGATIGSSLLKSAAPAIKDLTEKAKDLAEYAEEHGDEIVSVIKKVGIVAGTVFAVNKVAKFTGSVKTLINVGKAGVGMVRGLGTTTATTAAAAKTGTSIFGGLASAMSAHPALLLTGAVVGLGAGLVALYNDSKKLPPEVYKIRNEIEKTNKTITDNGKEVESEYSVYERYTSRLSECVDQNGKIKKGKLQEVKVIKNQLKDALGIEIDLVGSQIKQYNKLTKSIKKTIVQKKAQSLLDKDKDVYSDALQGKNESGEKIANYNSDIEDEQSKLNDLKANLEKVKEDLKNETSKDYRLQDHSLVKKLRNERVTLNARIILRENNIEDLKQKMEAERQLYQQQSNTIRNYERLQKAIESGNIKRINNAYTAMEKNLQRAGTASREQLQKQYNDAKSSLKKIKQAYDSGLVDKSVYDAAVRWEKICRRQLEKANYKKLGQKAGKSFALGISSSIFTQNPLTIPYKYVPQNKVKGVTPKGTLPGANGLVTIGKNAIGGIYPKGEFLTTFAEDSAEAAIPINNSARSKKLWLQTGKLMGMVREDMGTRVINQQINNRETNDLLRLILAKDSNMYIDGNRLVGATRTNRDVNDGYTMMLEERGIAIG